jgi:NAD-dependent SIR2 family protein deacetylase
MSVTRRHDMGLGDVCVFPKCEARLRHRRGIPCQEERCPECGAKMLREGSEHYRQWLEKKEAREQPPADD